MDIMNAHARSRTMAAIRGKNTTPELIVRKALHAMGLRFRLHAQKLPGKPDIVLPKYRAAVLVHGCFWHRHGGCRFATTPATRADFWQSKFRATVERDLRQVRNLTAMGWTPHIIWECETADEACLARLVEAIRKSVPFQSPR